MFLSVFCLFYRDQKPCLKFGKPCLCPRDTRHFRRFHGVCAAKRLFQGGPGSVRFGYGLGMERFERFRFSVPAVPLMRGSCVFQYSFTERTVPVSVPGKRFRFSVRFLRKRFRRFRFPVPVRFLGHPAVLLVRTQIRHFGRFRQKPPLLAGDKGTALIFFSLPFWISLLFSFQGNPCYFERFWLLFQGFQGFARDRESLPFLWVFPSFAKTARKRRSGGLPKAPIFGPRCFTWILRACRVTKSTFFWTPMFYYRDFKGLQGHTVTKSLM